MNNQSVKEYLANPTKASCNNFSDWFCRETSLENKQIALDKKVRKLALSDKIDCEKMYVWYKNNCPVNGSLYDDIRFSDRDTGDVIYTISPKNGHRSANGSAEVWGRENDFKCPLVSGSWKDVLNFFNV